MANENAVASWNSDLESKEAFIDDKRTTKEELEKLAELEKEYELALSSLENVLQKQHNLVSVKGLYDRVTVLDMLKRCKLN